MKKDTLISSVFRLSEVQKKALKKLHLETIGDLLYHFPSRYISGGEGKNIAELVVGEKASVLGTIQKLKTSKGFKTKIPMGEAWLTDSTGKIKIVWFHQPYLAKMIPENASVKVTGTVTERKGQLYFSNPEIERIPVGAITAGPLLLKEGIETPLFPTYPESRGISSRWFYYALQKVFASGILETLDDPLPESIRTTYNLPSLKTALVWIHTPHQESDSTTARKRFAFEEVFLIQLKKQMDRKTYESQPAWEITPSSSSVEAFTKRFSFTPTNAQQRAVQDILDDFTRPFAMSRLLEGDVGSGKTFVAAVTAHAAVTTPPTTTTGEQQDFGNLQVAYMAPTEILANQHFQSFIDYFKGLPIQIGLITSSGCKKFPSKVNTNTWTDISRTQLLKWVANGEIPILIGTHALIQKSVQFKHLAYVIIDEQHRFGTRQRAELAKKDTDKQLPHLLSMTATPIPRTLALTIYGDLDLTLLDELPPGRKEIITKVIKTSERASMYVLIKEQLKQGRQAYVICPRIDEPDETKANTLRAKSVNEEAQRLQDSIFTNHTVDVLHGKMSAKEKERVMKEFENHETDILVATSVVEVGVNVPNATVIVIEGAERFGLAQLHQLRGRVFRSSHQAYCFLLTESKGKTSIDRLNTLAKAKNGFELAEADLQSRGAGELYGGKQWGITDVGMEALRNIKMVEAARKEAQQLIENDPTLINHPLLKKASIDRDTIHFE